jgi:hypothetical protein
MPEERKVQFIFQNMEPTLMGKVFPQMDRLETNELFRRLQAHSQAALIAERSTPVNNILPVPPVREKEEIEKLVREEVSKSLDPIVRKLEETTQSMRTAGESGFGSKRRTPEGGQNWERSGKRAFDGRPICRTCGKTGAYRSGLSQYPDYLLSVPRFGAHCSELYVLKSRTGKWSPI